MTTAWDPLADRCARNGPVSFEGIMELALYHPEVGFYASGGKAGGRTGDFVTSPEVGALFGAVVARALDAWWHEAGRPDPYVVVEVGAGPGTLARMILAAGPECGAALRYVLVERSEAQRANHAATLSLEAPSHAFAPASPYGTDDDDRYDSVGGPTGRTGDRAIGPIVVSLAELPRLERPAVVLANELLDNLPFAIAHRTAGRWWEVRLDVTIAADGTPSARELPVPLDDTEAALLDRLVPDAAEGVRVPIQRGAARFVREALALARPEEGGRVVLFDYAGSTAELAARSDQAWLRTYRGHERGADPYDALGERDITADVAIDQLGSLSRPPTTVQRQAAWLRAHGIDELVEAARAAWHGRADGTIDLAALKARSRVHEGDALLDPDGLGGFTVLTWEPNG